MSGLWPVATHLIREVVRSRGFPVFIIALGVCVLVAPRLGGEIDLVSRLQLATQYGIGLSVVVIGIWTLVISSGSLGREIESSRIHLLVTRPIATWEVVLGKLLGVLLLDVALVGMVAALTFVNLYWIASASSDAEREIADTRFFTPRGRVAPDVFEASRLPPQEELRLVFSKLPSIPEGEELILRFRLDAVPRAETPLIDTRWTVGGDAFNTRARSSAGRHDEIVFPATLVEDDGSLVVVLRNDYPGGSAFGIVVSPKRFEIRYPSGSFLGNTTTAVLLVLVQLLFLGAVGLFGASMFSVSTAALVGAFVYLTGLFAPYLHESLDLLVRHGSRGHDGVGSEGLWLEALVRVLELVLGLLPDFTRDDPLRQVVDALTIVRQDVVWRYGGALVCRAVVLLGVASVFLGRREMDSAS